MSITGILRSVNDIKRLEQILQTLVKYELGALLQKAKITHLLPLPLRLQKQKLQRFHLTPQTLVAIFEELGGAFLKLGQLLSLRPDLIPEEYCDALKELQDNVKPLPYTVVENQLRAELKDKFSLIKKLEKKPLAAASIGQVHKAYLAHQQPIVLKVQRPQAKATFALDIDILEKFALVLQKLYDDLPFDPVAIVHEFKEYTESEFDYTLEAKNIERFYANFLDQPDIIIPRVLPELSTKTVLAMTYVEGQPITALIKVPRAQYRTAMLKKFLHAILEQILVHGVFHADPHPGNVLIYHHSLVFLDFGIVGFLTDEDKYLMRKLFYAVLEKDTALLTKGLLKLGVANYDLDRKALEIDIKKYLAKYYDVPVASLRFRDLFATLFFLIRKHKLRVPEHFVLLGKALMTTESVIQQIDPHFNLIQEAKRFTLKEKSLKATYAAVVASFGKMRDFLLRLPEKTDDLSYTIDEFNYNAKKIHEDLASLTRTIDRSEKIISLTLLFLGFLIIGYLMKNNWSFLFYALAIFLMLLLVYDFLRKP